MQLHAGDLDATMKFYEKHFGLKKTRYRDIPEVPHALLPASSHRLCPLRRSLMSCPAIPELALVTQHLALILRLTRKQWPCHNFHST